MQRQCFSIGRYNTTGRLFDRKYIDGDVGFAGLTFVLAAVMLSEVHTN